MTASSWTGTPATVTGSESMLTVNRTYKLQLEERVRIKLLIDGVYRNGVLFQKGGGTYTAR